MPKPTRDGIELLVAAENALEACCADCASKPVNLALKRELEAYLAQLGDVRAYVENRAQQRGQVIGFDPAVGEARLVTVVREECIGGGSVLRIVDDKPGKAG
jgi:hypothetical protein